MSKFTTSTDSDTPKHTQTTKFFFQHAYNHQIPSKNLFEHFQMQNSTKTPPEILNIFGIMNFCNRCQNLLHQQTPTLQNTRKQQNSFSNMHTIIKYQVKTYLNISKCKILQKHHPKYLTFLA